MCTYKSPTFGSRLGGGSRRVVREWELNQAVTPGEPEGNGRSCLMGETHGKVDEDEATAGGVDRSNARTLKGVHQRVHGKEQKTTLTVGGADSKIHALPLVLKQIRQTRQHRALHRWKRLLPQTRSDLQRAREPGSSTTRPRGLSRGVERELRLGVWTRVQSRMTGMHDAMREC